MPTSVYNSEEIRLINGEKVTLKSMIIKNRRAFMKEYDKWVTPAPEDELDAEKMTEEELEAKATELGNKFENDLLKLAARCVAGQRPEWDKAFSDKKDEEEAGLDALADELDEETIYYIIKQVAGIDLKKMNERAEKYLEQTMMESPGTN